jgi:Domain of unknown function (DUF427)
MTLTIGTGPFGNQSTGTFNFDTGALKPHTLYFEDSPRRVRVIFDGETIADSKRAKLMHETGLLPIYYFPQEEVRGELLEESDHTTHCPFKGDASYWSVRRACGRERRVGLPGAPGGCPAARRPRRLLLEQDGYVVPKLAF